MKYNTNVQVRAAYEVFPFLANFRRLEIVDQVFVTEINEAVLEMLYPPERSHCYRQLFLLNEKGEELGCCTPGRRIVEYRWWDPITWFKNKTENHETPRHLIERLGDRGTLGFQLLFIEQWLTFNYLHLCRAPKTYTILSWLEELERKRVEAVEAQRRLIECQISEIDAKGNNLKMITG